MNFSKCELMVNTLQRKKPLVYRTAAVRDALGTNARPGIVALHKGRITAAGSPDQAIDLDDAQIVNLPKTLLLPVFVNTHAHLDLTLIQPQPYAGNFTQWLRAVMTDVPAHNHRIEQALQQGMNLSHQAGVGYLGDITHSPTAINARKRIGILPGISYFECFGIGSRQDDAISRLKHDITNLLTTSQSGNVAIGIQPHAPYSAGLEFYHAAAELAAGFGCRLSTHLAETPEEILFVRDAKGPLADLLRNLGKWDDSLQPSGLHPIEWLEPVLKHAPWLLAHCNYTDDQHIEILARHAASVAYCPIASDYFGHHQPDKGIFHRYQDMLNAGVNVSLGTDSIICQQPDEPQPLGIGPQIRHLYRRDRTDPIKLLEMATLNGMRALGLPIDLASLQPGTPAVFIGVDIDPDNPSDPLTQALRNNEPMRIIDCR